MTMREQIWDLVSLHKSKSTYTETSTIVAAIEALMQVERRQGVLDAIDVLAVAGHESAAELVRANCR